jgi:hypothetical protein
MAFPAFCARFDPLRLENLNTHNNISDHVTGNHEYVSKIYNLHVFKKVLKSFRRVLKSKNCLKS